MLFVQVRKAMQRKKEIWSSRRTFFTPSSTIPSSAAAATTSHGATLSVIMFNIYDVVLTLNTNYSTSAHWIWDGNYIAMIISYLTRASGIIVN